MGFVEAVRILSAEFAACRFIIAGAPMFSGPDYLARVKEASHGLPIEFHGWQDDIGALFSRLDMLVVPSSDVDSTPRVVIEAFSAGIPVVAFPSGGIPEIVDDGKTGFLASAASPAALAERIRSVTSMQTGKLREVTERAREAWRAKYTLERYQAEVAEVIGEAFA
jgi:glycosyltransferase involved in cell wall biosynthesis